MTRFKCCLILLSLSFVSSPQAAIIPYLDQSDWLSALSGPELSYENFEGDQAYLAANSVNNMINSVQVDVVGGVGDPGPSGLTGLGYFRGELDSSGSDALQLKFSFDGTYGMALMGLQNDSMSNPSNLDLEEMALSVGSEYWVLSDLMMTSKIDIPFLGFASDELITSFTLFHAAAVSSVTRTSEQFYLDGLAFAQISTDDTSAPPTAVPEPSVPLLFISGMIGLWASRRRIKR